MALQGWEVWRFVLCVGIAGGLVYDLWSAFARRMGVVVLEWGMLGRALIGHLHGRHSLCASCRGVAQDRLPLTVGPVWTIPLSCQGRHCGVLSRLSPGENLLGWGLHYLWCILFALPFPLLWGAGFLHAPHLLPFLLITVIGKCAACFLFVAPALGYGLFIRCHYNPVMVGALVATGYCFAAMAQCVVAVLLAQLSKLSVL